MQIRMRRNEAVAAHAVLGLSILCILVGCSSATVKPTTGPQTGDHKKMVQVAVSDVGPYRYLRWLTRAEWTNVFDAGRYVGLLQSERDFCAMPLRPGGVIMVGDYPYAYAGEDRLAFWGKDVGKHGAVGPMVFSMNRRPFGIRFLSDGVLKVPENIKREDIEFVWLKTHDLDQETVDELTTRLKPRFLRLSGLSDEGAQWIKEFPDLTWLHVEIGTYSCLSDRGLNELARLKGLKYLTIMHHSFCPWCADGRWSHLSPVALDFLGGLENLEYLRISGVNASPAALEHIGRMRRLVHLSLVDCGDVNAGLSHLKDLAELSCLEMRGPEVSDAGLRLLELPAKSKLQYVAVSGPKVTDEAMSDIGQLPNLVYLDISGTAVGDVGLSRIRHPEKLSVLLARGTRISDEGMKYIENMTSLLHLDVGESRVGDAGMQSVAKLGELKSLTIGENPAGKVPITNVSLEHIGRLNCLKYLEIGDAHVTNAGTPNLRKMPELEWVYLVPTEELELVGENGIFHLLDTLSRWSAWESKKEEWDALEGK